MQRRAVVVGVLLISAILVVVAWSIPVSRSERPPGPRPSIASAPIGFVSTELLPFKKPTGAERDRDKVNRPYHALVEVLDWPELTPRDAEPERIQVPSGSGVERVGPGRFLVSGIGLGMSTVALAAGESDRPDRLVELGTGVKGLLAQRNPVAFARHGITVCELFILEEDDLAEEIEFRGLVYDRIRSVPIEGARIVTGTGHLAVTDAEGRFQFEQPVKLQEAFSAGVVCDGYVGFTLTIRSLSRKWIEAWRETGEMVVTLVPDGPVGEPGPLTSELREE